MFLVSYTEGAGDGYNFLGPHRDSWTVPALNRAVAYMETYWHFSRLNLDVTVSPSLEFTDEELRIVRDPHVPFINERLPKGAGIEIEGISPDTATLAQR